MRNGTPSRNPWRQGTPSKLSLPYPALSEEAVDLLRLLAFFAPENILLDTIILGRSCLPPKLAETVADEPLLQDALSYLHLYGLTEIGIDTVSLSPEVQAAVREDLPDFDAAEWAGAAVRVVHEAIPPRPAPGEDPSGAWPDLHRHAIAAALHADAHGVRPREAADLLAGAGAYLVRSEQPRRARTTLLHAIRLYESAPDSPANDLACTYRDLGQALRCLGEHREASRCFSTAMRIATAAAPPRAGGTTEAEPVLVGYDHREAPRHVIAT